jgi:PhnB protein
VASTSLPPLSWPSTRHAAPRPAYGRGDRAQRAPDDREETDVTVRLNPYLNFKDNAREAMTFYRSVFGGELTISTFADLNAPVEPTEKDLVMHSMLEAANGLVLMGADTPSHMAHEQPAGFSVSLSGDDDTTLRGFWDGLAAGGNVTMPLDTAPWGDSFGMLVDKFGITWLINIAGTPA